jgi:general secretion pathway protein E
MPYSEALQQFSEAKDDLPKLRRQAYQQGMRSLRLSGAQKVAAGITTMHEVLRVAPESR